MCWNLQVSLYAGAYGVAMSYYFKKRNFSNRDPWYALFLLSFTLTQFLDAFFWYRTNHATGILECDATNLQFSKWIVSAALCYQIWCLTEYPSTTNMWARPLFKLVAVGLTILMGVVGNCTSIYITSGGWAPGPTLLYWGFMPQLWEFGIAIALEAIPALLFIHPFVYCRNILAIGGLNLVLLKVIDGTILLVSKLCFYCLLLSVLWFTEPWWAKKSNGADAGADDDHHPKKVLKGVKVLQDEPIEMVDSMVEQEEEENGEEESLVTEEKEKAMAATIHVDDDAVCLH